MGKSGIALKALQFLLTFVEFGCAAVILAIFSYFLATLHNHAFHIDTYIRAVEGISGVAVVFTLAGLVFLWCFAGMTFFALIAIVLDIAFAGAFVYVAYVTRGGATSCKGYVNTPFGSGFSNGKDVTAPKGGITALPSLRTACNLEKATFAVAIIAIFFFLLSAFVEVLLMKSHRKDKRYGPSPANNYTAGAGKRKFWQRKPKTATAVNPNALPLHTTPADMNRASYATEATAVGHEPVYDKYGAGAPHGATVNNGQVADGYAAPMGTHTAAGTGTTAYGAQPYGTTTMPNAAHHGGVNPASNY